MKAVRRHPLGIHRTGRGVTAGGSCRCCSCCSPTVNACPLDPIPAAAVLCLACTGALGASLKAGGITAAEAVGTPGRVLLSAQAANCGGGPCGGGPYGGGPQVRRGSQGHMRKGTGLLVSEGFWAVEPPCAPTFH